MSIIMGGIRCMRDAMQDVVRMLECAYWSKLLTIRGWLLSPKRCPPCFWSVEFGMAVMFSVLLGRPSR